MWLRSSFRSSRFRLSGGLFSLFFLVAALFSSSARAGAPQGVFCLLPAGRACSPAALANPNVDGIAIRQAWGDLEPSEGHFDFSYLDAEIARATAAGKMVLLRILTQTNKPAWVTAAVTSAGGQFFTFDQDGVSSTIPVFWDPTFLAKKRAMIAALGAHFTGNPTIKVVAISFANASSEDWSVPHTPPEIEQWTQVGYTSQKLLDAGKTLLDAAMVAFPNQLIALAVAGNGQLDSDVSYVARNSIATARASWPDRLIVQKNSLAAFIPTAPGTSTLYGVLWDSRPDVAGQMLDASYGDTTYRNNAGVPGDAASILHHAIDNGVGYGMKYIEIYQNDVLNLPAEIASAHNALLSGSGPPPPPAGPKAPTGLRRVP